MSTAPSGLQLPNAPAQYDQRDQAIMRRALIDADRENAKQDREANLVRPVLTAPNGTRWLLTVDNTGTLGTTAL